MTPQRPKSVILLLDIDGTLLDTDVHLSHAMATIFKKYGVDFKPEEFFENKTFPVPNDQGVMEDKTISLFGGAWEMVYHFLKSKNPDVGIGVDAFRTEIVDYVSSYHDDVVIRQDVIDMILAIQLQCAEMGMGFAKILVTNAARKEALVNQDIVKQAGLTVDKLVSADDVTHRKSHPEPYLLGYRLGCDIIRAQGFDPDDALVIKLEDSPPGGKSACTAAQSYNGICFYVQTIRRNLMLPDLTDDEADHFVVEQDIAALGLKISTLLQGRGTLPHQAKRVAKADTAPT
ncbi:MAG: HAD family phosphatase [Alphaproteobacteria bacterium]|nr:HAD family phosphatase [Alphaproteobacteria bacterium]